MKQLLLSIFLLFYAFKSFAQQDDQLWLMVFTRGEIKNKYLGYLEFQPRMSTDLAQRQALMLRTAFGYQFFERHSFWFGYANLATEIPRKFGENRTYVQWFKKAPVAGFKTTQQARLEQRKFSQYGTVSHRLRYKYRLLAPLNYEYQIYGVFQNEFFLNLNTIASNNTSGPEQNRLYFGINKDLGQGHAVELAVTRTMRFIRNDTNELRNFFVARYTYIVDP